MVWLKTNLTAKVEGFHKRVWFHNAVVTNLLSLHDVAKKDRVTNNSAIERAFNVHYASRVVKYKQVPNGMHVYKPDIEARIWHVVYSGRKQVVSH